MAAIGKVSLRGLYAEDFQYTFLIDAGTGGATEDSEGLAVSYDNGVQNQVKLALDGEKLIGRLEKFEDREVEGIVTCTIALKGGYKFIVNPDATGSSPDETPAPGDYLVGAVTDGGAAGYTRKATTVEVQAGKDNWLVVEVGTDNQGNDFAIAINI